MIKVKMMTSNDSIRIDNSEIREIFRELMEALQEQKASEIAKYGPLEILDPNSTLIRLGNPVYRENRQQISDGRFDALCKVMQARLEPAGMIKTEFAPEMIGADTEETYDGPEEEMRTWEHPIKSRHALFAFGKGGILFELDCSYLLNAIDYPNPRSDERTLFDITVTMAACMSLTRTGMPCSVVFESRALCLGEAEWPTDLPVQIDKASAVVLISGSTDEIVTPVFEISGGSLLIEVKMILLGESILQHAAQVMRSAPSALATSRYRQFIGKGSYDYRLEADLVWGEVKFARLHLSLRANLQGPWSPAKADITQELEERFRPISNKLSVSIREDLGSAIKDRSRTIDVERFAEAASAVVKIPFKRGTLTKGASFYASQNPRTVLFGIGGKIVTNLFGRATEIVANLVKMAEVAAETALNAYVNDEEETDNRNLKWGQ